MGRHWALAIEATKEISCFRGLTERRGEWTFEVSLENGTSVASQTGCSFYFEDGWC